MRQSNELYYSQYTTDFYKEGSTNYVVWLFCHTSYFTINKLGGGGGGGAVT